MSLWWSDNHPRLETERAAVASLAESETWLENVAWSLDDSIRMQVVFDIRLKHGVFALKLIYHGTFPNSAPSVRPVDATRLSSHQYGNGDLCLEIRPDNWRPEFTGADMIMSAFSLLEKESPDEDGAVTEAPSAHSLSNTIAMRHASSRLYLSEPQLQILSQGTFDCTSGKMWMQWCGTSHVVAHLVEVTQDDWSWKDDKTPAALGREAFSVDVVIVKTSVPVRAFRDVKSKDDLVKALETDRIDEKPAFYCLVVPRDALPILFRQLKDANELIRYRTVLAPKDGQNRGGDLAEILSGLRVGVVGVGSVGSKVTVSLARAGVKRFDLVDDDILHPGNIDRHDGDWRDIGLHKVDHIKRRINLISTTAEVTARRVSIGAQVSASEMARVNGALSECDLIIDATANPIVLNHLAAISLSSGNSIVWGGVYAGGIGGYMARSRPEKDSTPHLLRQALNDFYATIDSPPPVPTREGYDGQVSEDVFIASDVDVSLLAAHLSSFALDTLVRAEPSDFDAPIYLLGFRRAWDFESAFQVQPISVDAPLRPRTVPQQKDPVQTEFVDGLLKKKIYEIAHRKKDA